MNTPAPSHRRFLFGVGAVLLSAPLLAYAVFEWTHLDRYPTEPARIVLADVPMVAPVSDDARPWVEIVDGSWVLCERADEPASAQAGLSPAVLTNSARSIVVYLDPDDAFPCELLMLGPVRGYLMRMTSAQLRNVLATQPIRRDDFAADAVFYALCACGGRSNALWGIGGSAAAVVGLWSLYPFLGLLEVARSRRALPRGIADRDLRRDRR